MPPKPKIMNEPRSEALLGGGAGAEPRKRETPDTVMAEEPGART